MTASNKLRLLDLCEQNIPIEWLDETDSTNTRLLSTPGTDTRICIADSQTQGRGQHARPWHSPKGENIYFSARYPFQHDLGALSGLSLAISVMLCTLLQEMLPGTPLSIKWPNDILCQNQKIAGILIELRSGLAIVGIGINVNMMPALGNPIDQPWTSLRRIIGREVDRIPLCAALIRQLPVCLNRFEREGLIPFLKQWERLDALAGKTIQIRCGTELIQGQAQGIDPLGCLVMITPTGERRVFASGESCLLK